MTPTDETRFIALWNEGLDTGAIAQRLGIPVGTVYSRAHRLQAQGKIPARPKGGGSPRSKALARQKGTQPPVQKPVQTLDTGTVQRVDTGAVQRLDRLEDEVQGLRLIIQSLVDRFDHPPVRTPVQITALPPYPKGKAVRWNLWILDVIRDELAQAAAQRGISPSQFVQECLWKALKDMHQNPDTR